MDERILSYTHHDLQYFTVYRYTAKREQLFSTPSRTYDALVFVEQGEVTIETGERTVHASAGDWLYLQNGTGYTSHWAGDEIAYCTLDFRFQKKIITMHGPLIAAIETEEFRPHSAGAVRLGRNPSAQRILTELCAYFSSASEQQNLLAASSFYQLWHLLGAALSETADDPGILRCISFIESDLLRPFRIGELCRIACMSRSALYEHFRAATGTTPVLYRNGLLVRTGRELIEEQGCTVEEASEALGFCSPDYFALLFRRYYGFPPGRRGKPKE